MDSSLPPHCAPSSTLLAAVSKLFGSCIPTYFSLFSTTCGILSIISWLFAQLPQIYKNYVLSSVEGLSLGFLAIWLGGDFCNFLGAVWTRQMWFQQVVGAYYLFVDCVLVGQYFYFTLQERRRYELVDATDQISDQDSACSDETESELKSPGKSPRRKTSRSLTSTLIVTVAVLSRLAGASPMTQPSAPPVQPSYDFEPLGRLLSWCSMILYLTSRLPQLLLNFRRRSTSGLAITLFLAAFCGNFFYSLSLLLNPLGHADYPPYGGGGIAGPEGSSASEWWGRSLPFFLGAFGVLMMDAAVGWQWWVWGDGMEEVMEAEGESGWWPWNGWWERKDNLEGEEEEEAVVVAAGTRYGAIEQ